MAARGQKSAASLAVASPISLSVRIAPPATLTPAQKSVGVSVVNAMPADWFGEEHAPMLTQCCRHKVTSDLIAQQLEAFDPVWFADDDGLKRFGLLATAAEREARGIIALMRSMRFTHQSLIRKDKVVKNQGKGLKP
ncbi:hypothetical protein [Pseudomonas frederiksbergensis]|uniref:hypothetical protein n=1 Tax=Pseudomonas frederiksbergensis TaxID=104087 RepID=UPI003D1DBC24